MSAPTQSFTANRSLADYFHLIRPSHWLKNAFVFAPLVFGKAMLNIDSDLRTLMAFVAFCLISSAVYIVNDILDRFADAEHPVKCKRPIAAGRIGIVPASILAGILVIATAALVVQLPWRAGLCIGIYAALNISYSFGLKHVVLVDIFIIAAGFMLRVLTGAKAIEVQESAWLIICTLFISLFLAVAKRRSEMAHMIGNSSRKVLDDYSPELIRIILNVSVTGSIMSYTLYTLSDQTQQFFHTDKFVYTVPIVMYGIFRYLYLDEKRQTAENPVSVIVRDPWLLVTGIVWAGACIGIVYLGMNARP